MSKRKKRIKELKNFVSQLSDMECREELICAYLQMENCQRVLRGEDVVPDQMMRDNGHQTDMELFYLCKKVRKELEYLDSNQEKRLHLDVSVNISDESKRLHSLSEAIDSLRVRDKIQLRKDEQAWLVEFVKSITQ